MSSAARMLTIVGLASLPPALMVLAWCSLEQSRLAWLGWLLYRSTILASAAIVYAGVLRIRRRNVPLREWWRGQWPGVVLAVVATATVFALVPAEMRVQFDETSLVGTSQNMHLQRSALMTTASLPYGGEFVPVENMVDKRPTLFAFVVSLLHGATGMRIANAYVANAIVLAVGMFLLFVAVRARQGLAAGLLAPLLLLCVPLVVITATSAGFELLATVMMLAVVMAARSFVFRPDDGRCAVFVSCCVLLSYCRYESILVVALLATVTLWSIRGRYRPGLQVRLLLAACPTLLAPLAFLLLHAQSPNFTPEAGGQAKVSIQYLADHLPPLLRAWLDPGLANPMPGLLGLVAVVVLGWRAMRRQMSRADIWFAGPVLVVTVVVLAWFYGDVRERTAWRLFLPLAWLTAVAPIWLLRRDRPRITYAVFALALVWLPLRWVSLLDGESFPRTRVAAMTGELDRMLARVRTPPESTLWVGSAAQYLIVKGHAAVTASAFQRHRQGIDSLRRQRDITAIYVIETSIDRDMAPVFGMPRELLQRHRSQVVERIGGSMPITVHRLIR